MLVLSFFVLSPLPPPQPLEPRTLNYDDHLRDLIDEERKYVRHLNLILKVFMEPFQNKNLFSQQVIQLSHATHVHDGILSFATNPTTLGGSLRRQWTFIARGLAFEKCTCMQAPKRLCPKRLCPKRLCPKRLCPKWLCPKRLCPKWLCPLFEYN